ncbi:MAG: hypothetical protein ACD_3C00205G0021 [uncultured bacterium (gcode 4)]|uniref:Heparan-alpha-glucosaminide N-acetyltransferase catalytic domain-containing protein n=1 Tax=uncultured bacterium (gcode 4) TaxID=1234023 RepID=K2FWY1_9BACT|nr:MAG: hypothetical protein ACD_3C00205G0021 [uncultured bacterium (gcode 4)]
MRYKIFDVLRWGFIIGMILFHFNFILVNFFDNNIFENEYFWVNLQYFWKLWFLFLSWMTFSLAQNKYKNNLPFAYSKKILKLLILSLLITSASIVFAKDSPIYFWVIHYFAVSYVLLLLFKKLRYWNLLFGILFIIIWIYIERMTFETWVLFMLWFKPIGYDYLDYFPLLPNFWYALLWFCLWSYLSEKRHAEKFFLNSPRILKTVEFLWRRSLLVYVLHTPVIFGFIWILYFLSKAY